MKKIITGIKAKPHLGRILSTLYSFFVSEFARMATLTSMKTEGKNIKPTLFQIRAIQEEINAAVQSGYSGLKINFL